MFHGPWAIGTYDRSILDIDHFAAVLRVSFLSPSQNFLTENLWRNCQDILFGHVGPFGLFLLTLTRAIEPLPIFPPGEKHAILKLTL